MDVPPPSDTRPLRPGERAVVVLDVVLGAALCALAAWLIGVGYETPATMQNPMEGMYLRFFGYSAAPSGPLFLLAALAVGCRWRGRWWAHLLPPLGSGLVFALGNSGLLNG